MQRFDLVEKLIECKADKSATKCLFMSPFDLRTHNDLIHKLMGAGYRGNSQVVFDS